VVGNYSENGIPLDVMWSDIDYLYSYRDFTYDTVNYWDIGEYINELHSSHL
jgi:alpha-glucosidase (family GH31 glycosyl hydrolase)